jgi:hypothetical protein
MLKTNGSAIEAMPDTRQQRLRAWLTNAKYYVGLIVLMVLGALTSPHSADGSNIFLSSANFSDVFRQVANVGVMSMGMTLVIITAGIDLSVGSVMGFGSVLTAILLTTPGSNPASWTALGLDAISIFIVAFVLSGVVLGRSRRVRSIALAAGCVATPCAWVWRLPAHCSRVSLRGMDCLAKSRSGRSSGWCRSLVWQSARSTAGSLPAVVCSRSSLPWRPWSA